MDDVPLDAAERWDQIPTVLVLGEIKEFPPDPVICPEVVISELYRVHDY
jgi:hypothetical protein